ncbi:MAG: GNAT family N-acetyltransferase [Pseudomonadota bacterium]
MQKSAFIRKLWKLNETACGDRLVISKADFEERVGQCDWIVQREAGFLLGIVVGKEIENFSYLWFQTRFENFLYVERVVVEDSARRQGLATSMIRETLEWCRERGIDSVVCQVYDRPPNPAGHAVCKALGFTALESVMLPSRDIVTMYQRSTAIATP